MPCYQCDDEDLAEVQAKRTAQIRDYHDQLQREADEAVGLNSKGFHVAFLELPPQDTPDHEDPEFVNDWNVLDLSPHQQEIDDDDADEEKEETSDDNSKNEGSPKATKPKGHPRKAVTT